MGHLLRGAAALLVFAFPSVVLGQATSWIKSYGAESNGHENADSVRFAPDGGSYMGTDCWVPGATTPDIGVARFDADGHVLWRQAIGGAGYDNYTTVLPDANGVWALAQTNSFGSDDVWALRFDSAGTLLQQFLIGGAGADGAIALVAAPSGAFTLAGGSSSFGNGSLGEAWLARVTSSGTLAWSYRYGSGQSDFTFDAAAPATGGGLYASGEVRDDPENGDDDVWVARFDDAGSLVWQRRFGTANHDLAGQQDGIAGTADGGVVVCAGINITSDSRETAAFRFDAAGTLVWQRRFSFPGTGVQSECQGVRSLSDGRSLLALRTSLPDATVLVELDASGDVLGKRSWEGLTPQSLDALPSGEALLAISYTQDHDAPPAYPAEAPWAARLLPGGSPPACGVAYDQTVVTDDPQLAASESNAGRHNLTVAVTPTAETPYARSFPEISECPCALPSWNGPLRVSRPSFSFTDVTIEWDPVGDSRIDVVRGDLDVLRATHGDLVAALAAITSGDVCSGNNRTEGFFNEPSGAPASGQGEFYLARGEGAQCPREGSYNDGSQVAPRDASVVSVPGTCP